MLRNPLTWLLLLVSASALAACCGAVSCDCQDALDDALFFRFDTTATTPRSFRPAEVDSVFLVRYPQLTLSTPQPAPDTALLIRTGADRGAPIILNNGSPFAAASSRKLNEYRYAIYLGKRRQPTVRYFVDNIQLQDRLVGDGCCTCNLNVVKKLTVDNQPYDLTDPTGRDAPVTVTLTKP